MKFGKSASRRIRLTRATIRPLSNELLIDEFENRKAVLASEALEPGLNGPSAIAKATKEYNLIRQALLGRKIFTAALLDWKEGDDDLALATD